MAAMQASTVALTREWSIHARTGRDVLEAERKSLELAERVGLDRPRAYELIVAIDELMRGSLRFLSAPTLAVRALSNDASVGIEVRAEGWIDSSEDPAAADSRLGLVRRLTDECSAAGTERGWVRVTARKWQPVPFAQN
jgi:hypothetical protein